MAVLFRTGRQREEMQWIREGVGSRDLYTEEYKDDRRNEVKEYRLQKYHTHTLFYVKYEEARNLK
jgi:hypothetical protein